MNTVTPIPAEGLALLNTTFQQIQDDPKIWNQSEYALRTACGTAYCVAGLVVHRLHPQAQWTFRPDFTGDHPGASTAAHIVVPDGVASIAALARDALGLTENEADVLFDPRNTLADLERIIGILTDPSYQRTLGSDGDGAVVG